MIKKIHVEDLELGMFISDFNTPWLRHPFFPNQIMVKGAKDIDRMLKYGMGDVHIDTEKGVDSEKAIPLLEANEKLQKQMHEDLGKSSKDDDERKPRVPFEVEFKRARELYVEAKIELKDQFHEVEEGNRVNGKKTQSKVEGIIDSIFRNRDAMISISNIKNFDEYTFHHCLNVAVMSLNLAINLGILDHELLRLGIGAVLHDLGKVRLPDGLIQKNGPLNFNEFEVVKTHAAHGAKIIMEARAVPKDCALVPLSHHERYDGSGYPRRLAGAAVGKFGLITSIADVYDAMTTNRPYQKGMTPTQALNKMYGWAGTHFHPIYMRKFIQCVGVYPVGTLVKLDTREIGVVVRQNRGELLRPWVRLIRAADGGPIEGYKDADLRDPDPRGEKLFARSVAIVLDPTESGINIEIVLGTPSEEAKEIAGAAA